MSRISRSRNQKREDTHLLRRLAARNSYSESKVMDMVEQLVHHLVAVPKAPVVPVVPVQVSNR